MKSITNRPGSDMPGRAAPRLLRALRRRSETARPGDVALPIDRLISPLRYDVLVRQEFLGLVEARLAAGGSGRQADQADQDAFLDAFLDEARSHAYHDWFASIAIRRLRAGAGPAPSPAVLDAEFRDRVAKTVRLAVAFREDGFDTRYPIMLRSAGPVARTTTGKTLHGRAFPADGCHRLALLRLSGFADLRPEWYRIVVDPRWSPPDNTGSLIATLGLTREQHTSFVALGYTDRPFTDPEALVDHLRAADPDRAREVQRLLQVDAPLLDSVSTPGG